MNIIKTYIFKILLSVWLFSLACITLFGQSRTNPFEIRQRQDISISNKEPVRDTAAVIKEYPLQDTLALTPIDISGEKSAVLSNPFDVDHVPVRKSAITERAEKLQTQAVSTQYSNAFLVWILLFSCVIMAILINLKSKLISLVYQSIFNENILKLFQREEQRGFSIFLLLLYLNFLLNISILAYLLYTHFGGQKGIFTLAVISGVVTLIYILKHTGVYMLGRIFTIEKTMSLYNFTIMIFNHAAGIILIPFNFLIAFAPNEIARIFLWVAVAIIGILLLLRTLRGLFVAYEYIYDRIFQIIVYLCAFEIAPVMICIKTIMDFHSRS